MNRKGQSAGSSAILIIVITVLIVLYILFLPPQERAALLGVSGSSGGIGGTGATPAVKHFDLFDEHIGRIEFLSTDEREHTIPSFRISTTTEGTVLKSVDSTYVRTSVFDITVENISFMIDEDLTSEVKLSFNVGAQADGRLIILHNGRQVVNDEFLPKTSGYVNLPADSLERYNTLTVGASSPGWAFWSYHEYQLNNLQIIGNVKDVSGAQSKQVFFISEEEIDNLDRALLKFYPDCSQNGVGRLEILINGRAVFSSVGDCGVTNTIELDEEYLDVGENEITFVTERGTYLLTNIEVKTLLKEPVYPIYYFDMDDDLFRQVSSDEEACGEVDGVCPDGCEEDIDKDCCFKADSENLWCDFDTAQLNDRCVSFVTESTCSRCESGYEERRGQPAEACEDQCGDDKDDECPVGCSKYLDKDCCFEAAENYWCDDLPTGRSFSAVCKGGIEPDERNSCPDRYYNDDGRRLSHNLEYDDDKEDELLSKYEVELMLVFPDRELKKATLLINGREVGLETNGLDWEYDISDYVWSGTNSIELVPKKSLDITTMKIDLQRVS